MNALILTLNNEQYRIRRSDPKNLIIERLQQPKDDTKEASRWDTVGYYGRLEDLVSGLLKMNIDVPSEGINMGLLRAEIKKAESSILEAIANAVLDITSLQRQSSDD